MGKNTKIAIFFAGNTDNIFFCGQAVAGHVHVETTETITMRGIRLDMTGKAHVQWKEGKTTYIGNQDLIHMYIDLMGSPGNKESRLSLQPGTYDLPFVLILLPYLPSSFEHLNGHVRYEVKAVIDRPSRFDDKAKVLITVVRSLDLNREPRHLREPLVKHGENPASGCCCVSGAPTIDVMLNKGLFTVGETILVHGEISNTTNTRIKYSTIALIQDIELCRRTTFRKVLATLERPAILRGCSDSWNDVAFVIPPVVPSRLDGCTIIDISYCVEVTAVFNSCCSRSLVRVDVIIGNIPLSSDSFAITSQPLSAAFPSAIPAGIHDSPGLEEPSFEEEEEDSN